MLDFLLLCIKTELHHQIPGMCCCDLRISFSKSMGGLCGCLLSFYFSGGYIWRNYELGKEEKRVFYARIPDPLG